MKKTQLFFTSTWISLKHSSRRLLCLLCVLLVGGGLVTSVLAVRPAKTEKPKTRVAIVNLDTDPLSVGVIQSVANAKELTDLFELSVFPARTDVPKTFRSVITIPPGFLESVLNGENLSPTVEYDASGTLEAIWLRQLSVASARALSAAQRGVYATQELMHYGEGIDPQRYNLLVMNVNMQLLRAFFDRANGVAAEHLSVSGALSLPQYFIASALAAFFFCYGFLYYPAVENLRRFSRAARRPVALFWAALAHILLLQFLLTAVVFALLANGVSLALAAAAAVFALLTGLFTFACALALPSRAACAAGCLLLTMGMALCGGGLLPLALMPRAFSAAARVLPFHQAMALAGGAFFGGETPPGIFVGALASCAVLFALCCLLWRNRRGKGES